MENSTNEENTKTQSDKKHLNIETITPDTENVAPLSRQESQGKSPDTIHETGTDNSADQADEQVEDSKNEDKTHSEDKHQDPGDEIETVSP